MAQRDVELRVRAKAQTDKSLERLSAMLKKIEGDGEGTVDGLNKSSAALREIGGEVARLQNQLAKLRGFEKLAAEAQKAAAAVEASQNQLRSSATELANVARQQDTARQAAVRYRAQLESEQDSVRELSAARKADADALKRVERDLARAQKAVERYNEGLRKKGVDPATDSGSIARSTVVGVLDRARTDLAKSLAGLDAEIAQSNARLEQFKVQTAGAEQAVKDLSKQVTASQSALASQKVELESNRVVLTNTQAAVQKVSAALGGLAADQAAIAAATDRANAELTQQRAAMERVTQAERDLAARRRENNFEGREALTIMQRIKAEVLALITAYIGLNGAIQSISRAINTTRDLEAATNRLSTVFDQDYARVAQEMDFVRGTADRLGIAMTDLGLAYSKFAVAADGAKFSADATRQVFIAVAEAGRVNKLSLDQLNGVFLALEQMISKGKIQAEELRGQLGERLPGAVSILADALGVTTAELDKMMEQGQVFSTESTMLAFADELNERFGTQLPDALRSLATEIGRFENDLDKVSLAFAEGVIPGVRAALDAFNEFVNSTQGQEFFVNLGTVIGQVVEGLAALLRNFDLVYAAGLTLISLMLASKVGGWALAIGQLAQSLIAARGAMTLVEAAAYRMGIAVGVAGGPFTILAAAIAAVATVAATFWASSKIGADDATLALSEHQRQVNAVSEAYAVAADKTGEWAENINNVTKSEAMATLVRLTAEYESRVSKVVENLDLVEMQLEDQRFFRKLPAVRESFQDLVNLGRALEDGSIGLEDYRTRLDELIQASTNDDFKEIALGFLEATSAAEEGEDSLLKLSESLKMQQAIVKGLNGDWSDFEAMQEDVKDVVEETNNAFDRGAAVAAYTDAIDQLKSKIPSLADDMKRLKEETELITTAWTGMLAAFQTGDYGKIGEILRLLGRYGNERAAGEIAGAGGGGFLDRLINVESGGNPSAKNPESSATGLGQFIESTWLRMFKQYFPEMAMGMTDAMILAKREDAELSKAMIELYAKENAAILQKAGIAINDANLYLAHFLGPGGATKLLSSSASTPVSDILGADQIAANQSILGGGKTAGDVVAWAQRKMGISDAELEGAQRLNEIEQDRLKTAQEQAAATEKRIADLDFEISQQELMNQGKERQAAIEAAIRDAKAENPNITAEELAQVEQLAARQWDLVNAKTATTLQEERVNQLYELRQQLLEQMRMAEESGDLTLAATLKTRIEEINGQLTAAIDNLIMMWQAAGGPEAEAAIAKFETMRMSIQGSKREIGSFGLSMSTWENAIRSGIEGFINAFDAMAQAIANGENAAKAFGGAMLQVFAQILRDIAMAIIKQSILNALLKIAKPGSLFEKVVTSMVGHTGGLVGSSAIGAGNSLGSWSSGLKYHTGGLAGLKPDEVSATLRVNEEILTEEDPRHRFNLGGESQPKSMGIRQVLAIGDDEIANAMSGRSGEKTVLTHIRRNLPTIKQMLS